MTGSIGIAGAADMARVLDALPRRISAKLLQRSLRKGADILRREARRRAPVLTGELKRGIRVRASRVQRRGLAGAAGVQVYVSRQQFYVRFVEYGSRHRSARPFLRPAFDATVDHLVDAIGQQLGDDIEAVARSLHRRYVIG